MDKNKIIIGISAGVLTLLAVGIGVTIANNDNSTEDKEEQVEVITQEQAVENFRNVENINTGEYKTEVTFNANLQISEEYTQEAEEVLSELNSTYIAEGKFDNTNESLKANLLQTYTYADREVTLDYTVENEVLFVRFNENAAVSHPLASLEITPYVGVDRNFEYIIERQFINQFEELNLEFVAEEEVNDQLAYKFSTNPSEVTAQIALEETREFILRNLASRNIVIRFSEDAVEVGEITSYIWLSAQTGLPVKEETIVENSTITIEGNTVFSIEDLVSITEYSNINEDIAIEVPEV